MNNCTLTAEKVSALKLSMDGLNDSRKIPELLSCLSSETRIKILYLLSQESEISVCDIAEITGMSLSAISHQLRCLRDLDIVVTRRESQNIFYKLGDSDFVKGVLDLI